jgi:hypothetical protein
MKLAVNEIISIDTSVVCANCREATNGDIIVALLIGIALIAISLLVKNVFRKK